jgi:molybdopterin/thiamine biosynthesis adenylyltransferase/rhodanese-related sulfurtransferase
MTPHDFTPLEVERYRRHLSLAGFGPEGQHKLKEATVLVVGAGGLSCPALLYLAAAGVGQIVVIDPDRVDRSNLQRQVLYTEKDIGRPKVQVAAERLLALNPLIAVDPVVASFSRDNAMDLVGAANVVIDGSDNFETRYLVNDACVLANKPLVYGAIQGFEGQLSVFNLAGGPTYRCLFPEPPAPGSVPNCADGGVLGVLPGLIGIAQATEAIKVIAGIGEPLSGRLWLFNALTLTTQILTLTADPRSREIAELPPAGYGAVCEAPSPHTPHLSEAPRIETEPPREVGIDWLHEHLEDSKLQLVDVREKWERDQGAIEPSIHIPMSAMEYGETDAEVRTMDPKAPTVVYCAAGVRSLRAAEILRDHYGFKFAMSLQGGYKEWMKSWS